MKRESTLEEQIRARYDLSKLDKDDPNLLYVKLLEEIRSYHPASDDLSLIERAYRLADKAHAGVKRKSGQPYIIHPLHVGLILASLKADKECIAAGLMHDVIEDTDYQYPYIAQHFGEEIADLVNGVTKLTDMQYHWTDKEDEMAENMRKIIQAMDKDIRVIIIKLADRVHNMRTMEYMKPTKQIQKSRETLDFYSPLALNLGLSKLKKELDDYSLSYVRPDEYKRIVNYLENYQKERLSFLQNVCEEIRQKISDDYGLEAKVFVVRKHIFSIYRKMRKTNKMIEQLYDIYVVRILVKEDKDCYPALGSVHTLYTPVTARFKDFIGNPKINNYRALHTTVHSQSKIKGKEGIKFEVQIRSEEMNRVAEYGIVANWKYREGADGLHDIQAESEKMQWLRDLNQIQDDNDNNQTFINELRAALDLFSDFVSVFTPKGKVVTLPGGSTVIDFAYKIHTDLGNHLSGAIVNEKEVPIDYVVQNGDHIQVLTDEKATCCREWEVLCKSPQARSKIRQFLRNQNN